MQNRNAKCKGTWKSHFLWLCGQNGGSNLRKKSVFIIINIVNYSQRFMVLLRFSSAINPPTFLTSRPPALISCVTWPSSFHCCEPCETIQIRSEWVFFCLVRSACLAWRAGRKQTNKHVNKRKIRRLALDFSQWKTLTSAKLLHFLAIWQNCYRNLRLRSKSVNSTACGADYYSSLPS